MNMRRLFCQSIVTFKSKNEGDQKNTCNNKNGQRDGERISIWIETIYRAYNKERVKECETYYENDNAGVYKKIIWKIRVYTA